MNSYIKDVNFFKGIDPFKLTESFGAPLYVYNEEIFRNSCRKMKNLIKYKNFTSNYSCKANSNITLLKIAHEEGLYADAMSPGEIFALMTAGFLPEQIFFTPNNVDADEFKYAIEKNVQIGVDSLSQLELYGKAAPGTEVAVRLNPGIGAGHHEKVITAGKKTKFGINLDYIDDIKKIAKKYNLKINGIQQHIGSLFMDGVPYVEAAKNLLNAAKTFNDLDFVDFGGGFGIPYKKLSNEKPLDVEALSNLLTDLIINWTQEYGKEILFKIEPGRFIPAESCILLGKVHAIKQNYDRKYIGTDLGFNILLRPTMYDSWHDVEILRDGGTVSEDETETVSIVGNICESGDYIAKDRPLPKINEKDLVAVLDAGSYAYSMSSNYNLRSRAAEVLINIDGSYKLIRRRDTFEEMIKNCIDL